MDISVVVVTYNEEKNIGACLDALLQQDYAHGHYEIIVVDGDSEDKTAEMVRQRASGIERLRIVRNRKRSITAGRNAGIQNARYGFVAFTDADCLAGPSWLKELAQAYEQASRTDAQTAAVGGANVPPQGGNDFQKALGIYLDSSLGTFNSAQGRNFSAVTKVKSLSCTNALYNKQTILDIGGFDERLGNISEDCDINMRLKKKGVSLYFIPGSAVEHQLRRTLEGWARNMALYGSGRATVSFKNKEFLSPFFILPLCFSFAFVLSPLGFLNSAFLLPWLYFPCICFYGLLLTFRKKSARLCLRVAVIFVATHFTYAFNLLLRTVQIVVLRMGGREYLNF